MTYLNNANNPKVSVIVPVYNVKPYISEALESVINQTYKNLEIIVVDDGSDDGSEKICDEYAQKDERIKVIHRKNGGLSAARNTGLDNISGEYVAFLDSDDVLLDEAIEKSVNKMLSYDVDCVEFRRILCRTTKNGNLKRIPVQNKKRLLPQGVYTREESLKAVANAQISAIVWTKLYKRKIWENLRFPEGHVYEDIYTIFPILEKTEKIYIMHDKLIMYRMRDGSITKTNSVKNIKDLIEAWSVFEKYIMTNSSQIFSVKHLQETQKKILANLLMCYAIVLSSYSPDKKEVLTILKHSIENYEKKVNIKEIRTEFRFIYYMIFNHQWLLSKFFLPCYGVYKFIRSIAVFIQL